MHRFIAILLLAFLPLQFSWAAVASYCGHETVAEVEHFGHHDHQHPEDARDVTELGVAGAMASDVTSDAGDGKASGVMDLDCGYCHGTCSMLLNPQPAPASALSTALPRATLNEACGAQARSRPERPQWLPLA